METQRHKAYSGKDAFAYMINHWDFPIGMMLAGLTREEIEKTLSDRKQFCEKEPFSPLVLGRNYTFCWGSYGSRQTRVVKAKLEMTGLPCSDEQAQKILDKVIEEVDKQVESNKKLMAQKKPGYVSDEEFEVLARKIVSG